MDLALHHRRSAISVQDLLCQNSSETSSCHSPTTNNSSAPSSAAFSCPVLSLDQVTHSLHNNSVSDIDPTSFSDQETWRRTGIETSTLHAAESPPRGSSPSAGTIPVNSKPDIVDNRQKSVRGPWRIEEDRLLIDLVSRYGAKHWSSIATHFPRRSGKQARERWMNQLNPNLKKKNWTADEDRTILRLHASMGNKWSAIAQMLHGRTDNSVKNRYNSTLKRAMKERGLLTPNLDIDEFVENLHARHYLVSHAFHEPGSLRPLEHVLPTKVCGGTFSSNNGEVHRRWSSDHLSPFRMELNGQPYTHHIGDQRTGACSRKEADYGSVSQMPRFVEVSGTGRSEPGSSGMNSSGHSPRLPTFHEVLGSSAPLPSKKMDTHAQDYRETSPCTLTHPAIPRHTLFDHKSAGIEESAMTAGQPHSRELYSAGNHGPTRDILAPSKIITKRRNTRC